MADVNPSPESKKRSSGSLVVFCTVFFGLLIFAAVKFFLHDPPEDSAPANAVPKGERTVSKNSLLGPSKSRSKSPTRSVEQPAVPQADGPQVPGLDEDTGDIGQDIIAEHDPFVYALSPAGIDGAIRTIREDIHRCYEKGVAEEDLTEGWSKFKFKIEKRVDDPDNADIAQITEVSVKDTTLDSEQVQECVMQLIDELWFDPPEDGVIYVEYPIYFEDKPED